MTYSKNASRVKHEVNSLLRQMQSPHVGCKQKIASELCMSARTLDRRLASSNTTFLKLLNRELQIRFCCYMVQGVRKADQLAEELGFSDSSYFYQWFFATTSIRFKEVKWIYVNDPQKFVAIFPFFRYRNRYSYSLETGSAAWKRSSLIINKIEEIDMTEIEMTGSKIRELSISEIEEVSAGLAPIVGIVIGAAVGAGVTWGLNAAFGGGGDTTTIVYC